MSGQLNLAQESAHPVSGACESRQVDDREVLLEIGNLCST